MTGATFLGLVGANPTGTLLDNLQTAPSAVKANLADTLNSTLRSQLSTALTKASLPALSGLVSQMPTVDIVASKDLAINAFVKQQLDPMVAKDPAMQQAVDGEIVKLTDSCGVRIDANNFRFGFSTMRLEMITGAHTR
jgi:hypothetical protein